MFLRKLDERLSSEIFWRGKRSKGGQKKRCKDILKASLKDFNIPIRGNRLHRIDQNGTFSLTNQRFIINNDYEEKRIREVGRKRCKRKARAELMGPHQILQR